MARSLALAGLVGGVAAHDFIGEGEPVGGDDERDDDLETVGGLVAAVAEGFEFAGLGELHATLEQPQSRAMSVAGKEALDRLAVVRRIPSARFRNETVRGGRNGLPSGC